MSGVRMFYFDQDIIALEKCHKWKSASATAYQRWKAAPDNLRYLLCAGTEIWYALYMNFVYMFDPFPPAELELGDESVLEDMLWDVALYGEHYFSEDPEFNMYFGYMYNIHPYYFRGYRGDYSGCQKRGESMIQKAARTVPNNPIYAAFAYQNTENNFAYSSECGKIWESVTPEQWGASAVQQYFFRMLGGLQYYPDAYEESECS